MNAEDERAARIAALGYDFEARELELVPTCNLCGAERQVEVARRDRYGYPARFCVCARCGLGFLSPRLTPPDYTSFYAGVYRPLVSAYHGRVIDAETVQAEQRSYGAGLVAFLRPHLDRAPADVLDVGGSTGVVAQEIRAAFGSTATVLDPAPDELAVAEAAGMETIGGFAEDLEVGERRWQLVLLCQTIDHLLDVSAALGAIRGSLAEDGRAFVDVLDVEFAVKRAGSIEAVVKIDHPFYLTRATALGFFVQAGLEVVAERLSDDGHWGFLLAPVDPRVPDWEQLGRDGRRFLERMWRLRASGRARRSG